MAVSIDNTADGSLPTAKGGPLSFGIDMILAVPLSCASTQEPGCGQLSTSCATGNDLNSGCESRSHLPRDGKIGHLKTDVRNVEDIWDMDSRNSFKDSDACFDSGLDSEASREEFTASVDSITDSEKLSKVARQKKLFDNLSMNVMSDSKSLSLMHVSSVSHSDILNPLMSASIELPIVPQLRFPSCQTTSSAVRPSSRSQFRTPAGPSILSRGSLPTSFAAHAYALDLLARLHTEGSPPLWGFTEHSADNTVRPTSVSPSSGDDGIYNVPWHALHRDRFGVVRRIGHPYQNRTPPKRKKPRTSFSRSQIVELEKRFHRQKYLASAERSSLARQLEMTDAQVKTWFQNRRTKWRRQTAEERELERQVAHKLFFSRNSDDITTVGSTCGISIPAPSDTL